MSDEVKHVIERIEILPTDTEEEAHIKTLRACHQILNHPEVDWTIIEIVMRYLLVSMDWFSEAIEP